MNNEYDSNFLYSLRRLGSFLFFSCCLLYSALTARTGLIGVVNNERGDKTHLIKRITLLYVRVLSYIFANKNFYSLYIEKRVLLLKI